MSACSNASPSYTAASSADATVMRWPAKGDWTGLVTILIFGSTFPVAKPVLEVMDPLAFSALRYAIASLFILALAQLGPGRGLPARADWPALVGLGLLGFTLFQALWSVGLALTTATNAAVIMATSPIWGALIAWVGGQPLPLLGWGGVVLAFLGVAVLINNSLAALTLGGGTLAGDLIWMANAALWALYSARSAPLIARLGALPALGWTMAIGALFLLPVMLLGADLGSLGHMTPALWLSFGWMAVIAGVVSFVTWFRTIEWLGIQRAMTWMYFVPVVAAALAVLFLGEPLTPARLLGAAGVLAGVALTRHAIARHARAPAGGGSHALSAVTPLTEAAPPAVASADTEPDDRAARRAPPGSGA